ncbi:MAG: methyltransferase domain-containing protein [Bacteroidota bacterium]
MKDIHGKAIFDYHQGIRDQKLLIHNNYDQPEEMPIDVFFRPKIDFTELEAIAIESCKGTILDLGAGAGAHSLPLQQIGFDVTALENSTACCKTLERRGVNKIVKENYQNHQAKYDTILCLMNGLGIAGKIDLIPAFLKKCMSLLKKDGQLLIDSSDIHYLYKNVEKPNHYYGEVRYQYEYRGEKGHWFDWVYADQKTLKNLVEKIGLHMEILFVEDSDQYLARISN